MEETKLNLFILVLIILASFGAGYSEYIFEHPRIVITEDLQVERAWEAQGRKNGTKVYTYEDVSAAYKLGYRDAKKESK